VSIEADLGSLASDKAPRDNSLRTNALETGTYPTARFVAAGPIPLPVLARGEEFERTIEGELTLHGVTRPLSLPVTARWDGSAVFVIGTAPIVLADYGITTPQTPVVSVQDRGSLEIQLVLRRS
jgi:polyisoprenoid-binding protein YceI